MRKVIVIYFVITACFVILLGSCGQEPEKAGRNSAFEGWPIVPEWQESATESGEGLVVEQNDMVETERKVPTTSVDEEIGDLTELFRMTDSNWNQSEEYQQAVKAYRQTLTVSVIRQLREDFSYGIGKARFMVGYIDDDAIPELFLCFSNAHISGVHVFTCLSDSKEVIRVGEFSSFGGLTYSHKKNCIVSQYGNQGFYAQYCTALNDGKPELIGAAISDGGGIRHEGVVGYYGFTVPDGVDGSRDGFARMGMSEMFTPDDYEGFLISDEEETKIIWGMMGNPTPEESVFVQYGNMYEVMAYSKES